MRVPDGADGGPSLRIVIVVPLLFASAQHPLLSSTSELIVCPPNLLPKIRITAHPRRVSWHHSLSPFLSSPPSSSSLQASALLHVSLPFSFPPESHHILSVCSSSSIVGAGHALLSPSSSVSRSSSGASELIRRLFRLPMGPGTCFSMSLVNTANHCSA